MKHILATAIAGIVYGSAALAQAPATITMPADEVRVVTFPAPVKTVYIGNPTIVDVTVIDSRRVFLQAKSFGTTNLLALDSEGRQVVEERVAVYNRGEAVVTLQRGSQRTTLSCIGERCEVNPIPGDQAEPYDLVNSQIEKRDQRLKQAAVRQ
jgi:Pilus formation protein N terminal region